MREAGLLSVDSFVLRPSLGPGAAETRHLPPRLLAGPDTWWPSPGPIGCKVTGLISTEGGDEMSFFWLDTSPSVRPSQEALCRFLETKEDRSVTSPLQAERDPAIAKGESLQNASPYPCPPKLLLPDATVKGRQGRSQPRGRAVRGWPGGRLLSGPGCHASPSPGRCCLACAFCPAPLSGTLLICVFIYQQHILNCIFMAQCTFHS